MTGASAVSGVDRYMEMLMEYLDCHIESLKLSVLRICLISDSQRLKVELVETGLKTLYIPLPCYIEGIIGEAFWMKRYGEQVLRIALDHLDPRLQTVIHIHTLNLIDIATRLKSCIPRSAIITHLHCIPWKGLINRNLASFVRKYSVYCDNTPINPINFQTNRSEIDSYTKADQIVCLTNCAQAFLEKMCVDKQVRTMLIPNGLSDLAGGLERTFEISDKLKIVFVGSLVRGKGLLYVLDAIRMAQNQGLKVQLDVLGASIDGVVKYIKEKYSDLDIKIHGTLVREEVMFWYRQADIGVIASLQEQCSYVAIEMAMMSLPIITTNIDGLDEMFIDDVNALKVSVAFSRTRGLIPDIVYMSECILRLAQDKSLRARLGNGARKLFLDNYTLEQMGTKTIQMYEDILGSYE